MLIILKICYSLPDLEWHLPHPVGQLKSVEASQVTWAASNPKVQHRSSPNPSNEWKHLALSLGDPLVNSMSGKEYRQSRLLALYISLAEPSMYPVSDFLSNLHVDYSNPLTSSGYLGNAFMDWVVVSSCMAPSFCPSCCWHHHFQSSEYSANNLENLLFFTWPWMTYATPSWSVEISGSITSHIGCIKSEGPTSSKSPNPSNEWKHLSLSHLDPSRQFNVRKRIQTIKIISIVYQLGPALHVPRVRFLV